MYLPVRKSPRRREYNHSSEWCYFITIVTKDRENYFGNIIDGNMILNDIGKICEQELMMVMNKRSIVFIHEYIVMPNHVHMLLLIGRDVGLPRPNNTNDTDNNTNDTDKASLVPTAVIVNQSLGSVVGWRKSAVSRKCKEKWLLFAWQPRYYDHIIRNEREYDRIKYYIQTNPKNWYKDKLI